MLPQGYGQVDHRSTQLTLQFGHTRPSRFSQVKMLLEVTNQRGVDVKQLPNLLRPSAVLQLATECICQLLRALGPDVQSPGLRWNAGTTTRQPAMSCI